MTKKLLTILLVAAAVMLSSGKLEAQKSEDAYLIRTFDQVRDHLIDINTSGGSIQVLGTDGNEAIVEMYVRQNNRYLKPSDTDLEDFEYTVEQSGNEIRAHAKRENNNQGWRWFGRNDNNISISFIAYVPRQSQVDAHTSGGSITAGNLDGDIQLRTSGGSINLNDLTGVIQARTSGGGISIENVEGDLLANTSGGSIRAMNGLGTLDLRTSGGSITLDDISGTVTARTSGGSIRAKLLSVGEHVDLHTSGGSITIEIPGDGGYDIDLSGNSVQTELRNFSGSVERDRVTGRILEGGPSIKARTSGGTVRILYL